MAIGLSWEIYKHIRTHIRERMCKAHSALICFAMINDTSWSILVNPIKRAHTHTHNPKTKKVNTHTHTVLDKSVPACTLFCLCFCFSKKLNLTLQQINLVESVPKSDSSPPWHILIVCVQGWTDRQSDRQTEGYSNKS